MKSLYFITYIYFLILFILLHITHSKLVKVIEITRHGARTPMTIKPDGYLQERLGQLTLLGYNQHLLLGKWNRKRYIENTDPEYKDFLPKEYNHSLITVYSSRYQRTQFSAMGNLSGMYPGIVFNLRTEDAIPLTTHATPPIEDSSYLLDYLKGGNNLDIKVTDKKKDYIFRTDKCNIKLKSNDLQQNHNLLKKRNTHRELSKLLDTYFSEENRESYSIFQQNFLSLEEKNELKSYLDQKFGTFLDGKKVEDLSAKDFAVITDYIHFMNFSYQNAKDIIDTTPVEKIIRKVTLRYIKHYITTDRYIKIINTPFIKNILTHLKEGIEMYDNNSYHVNSTKFVLYSAHDRNIQNFILTLFDPDYLSSMYELALKNLEDKSAFDFLMVPYASSFIFELHNIDGVFYIRIIYNGKEIKANFRKIYSWNLVNYHKDKGFLFKDFRELLDSRIDKNIAEINC